MFITLLGSKRLANPKSIILIRWPSRDVQSIFSGYYKLILENLLNQ